jgi:predicted O-methyltransferase YrrM
LIYRLKHVLITIITVNMDLEAITEYCENLNTENDDCYMFYKQIIEYDTTHMIPAVRYSTALLLSIITAMHRPASILEIGFGSGASSLFMHRGYSEYDTFLSFERDNNRWKRGKSLLRDLGIDTIQIVKRDALPFIQEYDSHFDMVFMDGVKREYLLFLEPLTAIINKGGILVTDNILYNGKVTERKIESKYREGVALLKAYNSELSGNRQFNTVFLAGDDGLAVSIKK